MFEREDGERFSNRLIAGRTSDQVFSVPIFEQLEITREQKTMLIQMLNRPPRAADFTAVKQICEDDREGAERWKAVFAQYRPNGRLRPARYDDLDFLYLLSLTAEPGDVSLGTDDIVSTFARKDVERARVLQQFLPEADLKPAELRSSVQQIDQRFQGALIFSADRRHRRVALEAAEALRSMPGGDLPSAGLGHFFWALFWHDRFGPRARQAFWMRKLAYHARAMDPVAIALSRTPTRSSDGPWRSCSSPPTDVSRPVSSPRSPRFCARPRTCCRPTAEPPTPSGRVSSYAGAGKRTGFSGIRS